MELEKVDPRHPKSMQCSTESTHVILNKEEKEEKKIIKFFLQIFG
jgi:hypothetical protein